MRPFVSVSDVATGIHPEILTKLFTKFTTRSNTGTGLGLYISKSIVEVHGGRIWAKNKPDSKGAIITYHSPSNCLSLEYQ